MSKTRITKMTKILQQFMNDSTELSHNALHDMVFDFIFVIPTSEKNRNGYRVMYIFGERKGELYFLSGGCDVVSFKDISELRFDTKEKGVICYWNRNGKIKCAYAGCSCDFYGA